ncbi:MAG: sigma-70 family RNA polymerase sigma factor [Deltaproteobacteria bacterium]|nr:sigma-70 family RNA polymerase sigma factor [Deltaproteobacteria bacterium]
MITNQNEYDQAETEWGGPAAEDLSEDAGVERDPGPTTETLVEAAPVAQVREDSVPTDALGRYFREMAAHQVLTPEAEVEAAREIESLEIDLWCELLSHPPATELVMLAAEAAMENSLPEFTVLRRLLKAYRRNHSRFARGQSARFKATVRSAAEKLRTLDIDRAFIARAEEAVSRALEAGVLAPGRSARTMQRVARARRLLMDAKNRFVAANLRLVVSMARRYDRGRMPLIDIIQEGNIGLMKAVERFDYRRGYRFSTYASWWIRHAISRGLADKGRAVRIPVHMLDTVNRVARARAKISARLGREPTPEEIEAESGVAMAKLEKIRPSWTEQPFSLDRPVNDEDGRRFIDFLQEEDARTPDEELQTEAWERELPRLLGKLTPMEASIIRWRFGLDDQDELTLREIGDKYDLSRERIRQLQEQALAKMRHALEEGAF